MADELLQDKEAFKPKMSDEQLLAQIKLWEEESEEFYGGLRRDWVENKAYYNAQQTGVETVVGNQSKAVENRVFMATETMIPIATARPPEIEITSFDEDELSQIKAKQAQDIIGYHMDRLNIQEKGEQFIRDIIVKRYGVFKVCWEKEDDDVGLKRVDPERLRVPKFGMTVDDLKYVIEELEMSYDAVVSYFGKDKADELLKSRPVDSDGKLRKKTFIIKEVWTNEFVAWKAGNLILDSKPNPYYDFEDDSKNFFTRPRKPYVIKSLFQTGQSIIGETDYIQQIKHIQDNINRRKRQIEDIAGKVANPNLAIDSDVMSEEEVSQITNEPGQIIYGKDAANENKIRFHQPGNMPAYLWNDLEFSRQEFDNIWGIHSTTRGEREGRETATGRKLLRAADLGRIDLVARQFERALDEIAEWWVQLIKMFYTDKHAFVITGEEGIRFVQGFTGGDIGKIKLVVRPGSTLPRDEITIHEEAKQLWQLGAIGLLTMYKMLRLPNIPEAVDDFINTKTGAILQRGGAPMTPPTEATPAPAGIGGELNQPVSEPIQPQA